MFPLAERIWWLPRPSMSSAYFLLLWDRGSRHDPPGQEGLMHFLEHALFKGTRRHKAREIFQRIERHGGELNAFTTKDKMGLEVRVAPSAVGIALGLLKELSQEAAFPPAEVEKERSVILEELAMYEDIPEESLLDRFEEQIFEEGGLRHPVIGYVESVKAIAAESLYRFYREELIQAAEWVLLIAGPFKEASLIRALHLSGWTEAGTPRPFRREVGKEKIAPPTEQTFSKPIQQAHLVVGGVGPRLYDWGESLPLQVLLHEIGGPQLSSRLNMRLRERYGWCYTVYTFLHTYPERSVWGIYAGLTPHVVAKAQKVIQAELDRWASSAPSEATLLRMKKAFLGKQALLWESVPHRLFVEGRILLDTGTPMDVTAWKAQLANIAPVDVRTAAETSFTQVYTRLYIPQ
ncbi:MAG: insulinase family protein [Bacteroidia bacterium]|nr:insulinase family protein [Bacteroidia bacterium]